MVTAFTAKRCLQKSNYITERAAKRLQLGSMKGTKHKLDWGLGSKGQRSTFIVVSDDAMDSEVALGSNRSIEETQKNQDNAQTRGQNHQVHHGAQPLLRSPVPGNGRTTILSTVPIVVLKAVPGPVTPIATAPGWPSCKHTLA